MTSRFRVEVRVRLFDERGELAEVWGCDAVERDWSTVSMETSRLNSAFLLRAAAKNLESGNDRMIMREGPAFERERAAAGPIDEVR